MHSCGSQLVKFMATPAATGEVELLSPIRPVDRLRWGDRLVLLFSCHSDFPNMSFYREQKTKKKKTMLGDGNV